MGHTLNSNGLDLGSISLSHYGVILPHFISKGIFSTNMITDDNEHKHTHGLFISGNTYASNKDLVEIR